MMCLAKLEITSKNRSGHLLSCKKNKRNPKMTDVLLNHSLLMYLQNYIEFLLQYI